MNKYLSLIYLYNRAGYKKLLAALALVPLGFLAIFLLQAGNPGEEVPYLLMERGFCGMWPILILLCAILLGSMVSVDSINGRKAAKTVNTTTGYLIRRLGISPGKSFLTMFVYYLVVILLFWSVAIASLYIIGKTVLLMANASSIDTKLALGFLRTEIGHGLIPLNDPQVMVFNVIAVLALAGECARGCYFSWHNRNTMAGELIAAIAVFYIWMYDANTGLQFLVMLGIALYALLRCGDVIYREKVRKGDPFKVNKYAGITDFDSEEFDDEVYLAVNRYTADSDEDAEASVLARYGRDEGDSRSSGFRKWNPFRMRHRFMPLGSNLEKANTLFGISLLIGAGEHLLFFARWKMQYDTIIDNLKGVTLDSELMMPYFWELQKHSYYGYIIAVLLVVFLQAYWNYAYYNKETKSVYVMKRLPDRKEYTKTIWLAPVLQGVAVLAFMVLHIAVDIAIYSIATPAVGLQADYLAHIFPF